MDKQKAQLALSCTFAIQNGQPVLIEEVGRTTLDLTTPNIVIDGKYKILGLIAEGGMGAVYRAHHQLLQKDMALKTFRSRDLSSEEWQGLLQEARSIARLRHPNIVEVFDFGIAENDLPYYTMTLLHGESLAQKLEREGLLQPGVALSIFLQVARALAHAHSNGIVHRDIKPANIFLESNAFDKLSPPRVKILDFGIASLAEAGRDDARQSQTQTGTIFGSPLYMSPEQINGLKIGKQSDMYSFGCALFEALTGDPPFRSENAFATMLCHLRQEPPRLSQFLGDRLPQRLEGLVSRLLRKTPQSRYQSFSEIVTELEMSLQALSSQTGIMPDFGEADEMSAEGHSLPILNRILVPLAVSVFVFGLTLAACYPMLSAAVQPKKEMPVNVVNCNFPDVSASTADTKDARKKESDSTTPFLVAFDQYTGEQKFLFPDYDNIGFISNTRSGPRTDCRGSVTSNIRNKTVFHAANEIFEAPQMFRRFGPEDLWGVDFLEPLEGEWTKEKVVYCDHLSRLREVYLHGPRIKGDSLAIIEKLPNLIKLDISRSSVTGADLVNCPAIRRIRQLDLSEDGDLQPFLEAAASSGKYAVNGLELVKCGLTDADLETIARIKTVRKLYVKYNDIHGAGLSAIADISNVRDLTVSGNPVERKYFPIFIRCKKLERLAVDAEKLTDAEQEQFKRAMWPCRVFFEKADPASNEE